MCAKQCRDENGFRWHCSTQSHLRQMQIFEQNPSRIVDGYSDEFEGAFLDHVRRSHRHTRIAATVVYSEFISDRHRVHMNATRWATLTDFVKHLGLTCNCKVEETPKGWFLTYVDRDPDTVFKDRLTNKRLRSDLTEEEKHERMVARQIDCALAAYEEASGPLFSSNSAPSASHYTAASGNVTFSLAAGSSRKPVAAASSGGPSLAQADASELQLGDDHSWDEGNASERSRTSGDADGASSSGFSVLDELMREEEQAREVSTRKPYWLCEGIVVKVLSKDLVEKGYYKQKRVVTKVLDDKFVAEIEMLEKKGVLQVDQEELETVIPRVGGMIRIVSGAYMGSNARILSVNPERFCAKVQIEKGLYDGRILPAVDMDDICKLFQ